MFDHETRIEIARSRFDQLQRNWGQPTPSPARHALGSWLIRLGERLAPAERERRPSALPHEALPRC